MFLSLFGNAIALLAAFLGKMKEPKYIKVYIGIMIGVCIVLLVLFFLIEKPVFKRDTPQDNAPQSMNYQTSIPINLPNDEILLIYLWAPLKTMIFYPKSNFNKIQNDKQQLLYIIINIFE